MTDFLLGVCPRCGAEWNYWQELPEFDPLKAITAVHYSSNCPKCGSPGVTFCPQFWPKVEIEDEALS